MAGDYPDLVRPGSVEEAVAELARLGDAGAPLAGCTWIMRAPSRGERLRSTYVSLQDVGLDTIEPGDPTRLGARATHAQLAALDGGCGPLGALAEASRRSANRAIRNTATLAGNVCAHPFAASDLVPALLAGEASVEVLAGRRLDRRARRLPRLARLAPAGELVTALVVPAPAGRRSWYERLTVRGASEYPIVGVAVSVDVAADGTVAAARVAVGAAEDVPRRVAEAEAA
ncbi:MAG: FAD binding domain-containing protein [Thermoleophilia bacterium]